jgi:hypothetical protein
VSSLRATNTNIDARAWCHLRQLPAEGGDIVIDDMEALVAVGTEPSLLMSSSVIGSRK